MLVVQKIDRYMAHVYNTKTKTPFQISTHWLELGEPVKEGQVIKVIVDEVNTKRYQKDTGT